MPAPCDVCGRRATPPIQSRDDRRATSATAQESVHQGSSMFSSAPFDCLVQRCPPNGPVEPRERAATVSAVLPVGFSHANIPEATAHSQSGWGAPLPLHCPKQICCNSTTGNLPAASAALSERDSGACIPVCHRSKSPGEHSTWLAARNRRCSARLVLQPCGFSTAPCLGRRSPTEFGLSCLRRGRSPHRWKSRRACPEHSEGAVTRALQCQAVISCFFGKLSLDHFSAAA